MNLRYCILALLSLLVSCQSNSQNRIRINIPTAETEAAYIWRTVQDIRFFEEHNYQVSLPSGQLMDTLKQKAKSGSLNNGDYENLEQFVKDSIYNKADYQQGYKKIENELALINKMINQIDKSRFDWHFKEFKTYSVNLTLYGPGGSYNPDEGSILIYTTTDGRFKNYDNPANTIIHEIIHIGIEEAIISQYAVPHPLKERIVDTIVSLCFGQYLPDYRIQNMGDLRIDPYLKELADLKALNQSVEQILSKN
ncbi:MAG: hypothetical protein AAF990_16345 [Bacteroidota bacterium]